MKKFKKVFALLLIMALGFSLLVGCSNDSNETQSNEDTEVKPDEIVYAFVTFNNVPESTKEVEEAINKITIPKINVKVKLRPYSISSYQQQVNLALQSGEQLDVFHSLGDLDQLITKQQILSIDDLLDEYALETRELEGDMINAAQNNGQLYGVPAYKGVAYAPSFIYRKDIMEEIGIDPESISDVYDLEKVFAKVQDKYPDMIPLAAVNQGDVGMTNVFANMNDVDFLSGNFREAKGALIGDSYQVVDFYSSDVFKEEVQLARDWYKKGYIGKDAAISTTLAPELISTDRAFGYITSYAGKYASAQVAVQTGKPIGLLRLGEPQLASDNVNAITWVISSQSETPEAAMKFLNLTFTDKDIVNLLVFGIEDRDYVKVDDVHVKYPEGEDSTTVPYTAQISNGIIGNQFLQYMTMGADPADLELMNKENQSAKKTKSYGFTFDSSNVSIEISSITNVINEYLPGLQTGSLDPERELSNFTKALEDAGMGTIIKEKQKQLDEWLETQ